MRLRESFRRDRARCRPSRRGYWVEVAARDDGPRPCSREAPALGAARGRGAPDVGPTTMRRKRSMKDLRRALSWRSQVEMNVTDSRCPRCTHSIASHDTIAFDGVRIVHL